MNDEIRSAVIKNRPRALPGQINGWKRMRLKAVIYPGLIKGAGELQGILIFNISMDEMKILDIFEGHE